MKATGIFYAKNHLKKVVAIRNDGTVIIDTLIDTDGFSKGVKNMESQIGGLGTTIKKIGATVASAFAVREIVRFGKEAIALGSDLEEVQNVVDVVFGEMSGAINQFANDAIEAYGLSVTSAKKYTSTMGAMLKSMGLSTGAAAEMSMQLTGLAGDMASFYNLDPEEAFSKIRSGISGETEPLKQLGINLSVANLEAFALAQGISKSYSAMSQQEQALLRYNYLLRVTADAQGDFARTSGSWANQVRILKERFNQLKATLGQGFIAALTPVIKVLNTLLGYLQKVADAFASVMSLLFGKVSSNTKSSAGVAGGYASDVNESTAKEMESVADSYDSATDATDDYRDATVAAAKEAKRSLAGFDELNRLLSDEDYASNAGNIGGSGGAIKVPSVEIDEGSMEIPEIDITANTEVEDTISPKIQAIVDKIKELIEPLKNIDFKPLAEAFERFKKALEPITRKLFEGLEWAWHNLLVPLAKWTIEDLLPAFLDLLSAALKFLNTVIDGLKPLAEWLWNNFLKKLAEWTGGVIIDVIHGIADALNKISDWISQHQAGVNAFIAVVGSIAGLATVVTTLSTIATAIKEVALAMTGAQLVMSPLALTISGWITKVGGFFTAIGTKLSALGAVIVGWGGKIGAFFTSVGTVLSGFFSSISTALVWIAEALGVSVGWVAAIVAAVAAAVAAIIIYWDELVVWAQNVALSLSQLWQNILLWIENIKVKYEELKATIIKWAQQTSKAINDQFITPIKEWFDELIKQIREWFNLAKDNIQEAFEKAASYIDEKFVSPVKRWMQQMRDFIAQIFDTVKSKIVQSMENAGKLIYENFIIKTQERFAEFGDRVIERFRTTRDRIKDVFQSLPQWFLDNVTQPIYKFFDNLTNNIIAGLNSLSRAIASIISSFNNARSAISSYSYSSSRSYTVERASYAATPEVPYLARGAVIPANAPFMAVLGDQRHGTNIEAPLTTIQEAVALIMDDVIQSNLVGFEAIVSVLQEILETILGIEIGDQVIAEAVQRHQAKMAVVRGG